MACSVRPTLCVSSVSDIPFESLLSSHPGIKAITWDLDKTLIGQHGSVVPTEHLRVMGKVAERGLAQGIVSNAGSQERTDRVIEIAGTISCHIGHVVEVVTSRMAGGKKKPQPDTFNMMAHRIGVENNTVCHVGDQLLKDVLGANIAGYGASILVAPFGDGDDPRVKYLQRPVEAVLRPFIGLPLLTRNFKSIN